MIPHWNTILIALNTDDFEYLLDLADKEGFHQEGVTPEELKVQLVQMGTTGHPLFNRVLRSYCALCLKPTIERMK
jgi:hypothetical protein